MKKIIYLIIFLMFLKTSVFAENVITAIGLALPPYVLQETNSGIEMDIVKEALAYKNHVLVPKYVLEKALQEFNNS